MSYSQSATDFSAAMRVATKSKQPEFLTSGQVARILDISPQHVRNLVMKARLPVASVAGKGIRLFLASDVERLAKEREETPTRPGPAKGTGGRPPKKKATKVTKTNKRSRQS